MVLREHLEVSRLVGQNISRPMFIVLPSYNCLAPTADGSSYELTIPIYDPNSPQYFTWVERDLGQCVLALLKHYKDDSAKILGETFYAVSDKMNYTDYAKTIEKGSVLSNATADTRY